MFPRHAALEQSKPLPPRGSENNQPLGEAVSANAFQPPTPTLLNNDQGETENSLFTDLAGLPSAKD